MRYSSVVRFRSRLVLGLGRPLQHQMITFEIVFATYLGNGDCFPNLNWNREWLVEKFLSLNNLYGQNWLVVCWGFICLRPLWRHVLNTTWCLHLRWWPPLYNVMLSNILDPLKLNILIWTLISTYLEIFQFLEKCNFLSRKLSCLPHHLGGGDFTQCFQI